MSNPCTIHWFRNSTTVKHVVLEAPISKAHDEIFTFASKIVWWLSCLLLALFCAILAQRCQNIKWKSIILEPTSSNIAPQTLSRWVATGLQDSTFSSKLNGFGVDLGFHIPSFSSISPSILHGIPTWNSAWWRLCARSALNYPPAPAEGRRH